MLTPVKDKSRVIECMRIDGGSVLFESEHGTLKLSVYDEKAVRVSYTEGSEFRAGQGDYLTLGKESDVTVSGDAEAYYVNAGVLCAKIVKRNGAVSLYKTVRSCTRRAISMTENL